MSLLQLKNLSVSYLDTHQNYFKAIKSLTFDLKKKEILGIVGESGSGKTTIVNAVMHILPRSAAINGKILFHDKLIDSITIKEIRGKKISYISQNFYTSLIDCFTIGSQFDYLLRSTFHFNRKKRRKKTISLLEKLNFENPEKIFKSYPFELSGGKIQRASIAMALACEPEVLIADEPTSSIDPIAKHQFFEILRMALIQYNLSIMIISHDLDLISSFCDRIIVMLDGKIIESGISKEVFNNPLHPYTNLLINSRADLNKDRLPEKIILNQEDSICSFFQWCEFASSRCINLIDVQSLGSHYCLCNRKV